MTEILKVKDNKDLVRLKDSKAVLNVNTKQLDKYKQDREEKLKLKNLFDDNEKIKNDIDEIKSLLRQLIGQK
jgi:flagellar biosynthesis/type III secretory pathway chaperone